MEYMSALEKQLEEARNNLNEAIKRKASKKTILDHKCIVASLEYHIKAEKEKNERLAKALELRTEKAKCDFMWRI
jgi:hypothetical protein